MNDKIINKEKLEELDVLRSYNIALLGGNKTRQVIVKMLLEPVNFKCANQSFGFKE